MLRTVDLRSIDFHVQRHDFEKWVKDVFGDERLAQIINRMAIFQGENRRSEFVAAIQGYLTDLRKKTTDSLDVILCKTNKPKITSKNVYSINQAQLQIFVH